MEFIVFAINYKSKIHHLWFKKNNIINHIENNMILDIDDVIYECDSSCTTYQKSYPEDFIVLNSLKHISKRCNLILNCSFSINTIILDNFTIFKDCIYSIVTYTFSIYKKTDYIEIAPTSTSLPDLYNGSPLDYYFGSLYDILPTQEAIEDTFTYFKNKLK